MGRPIKKGSTDQSTVIRIIDSTNGTPENAVEHDTSGIDLWFRREKETKTSITEVALASLDAAHSDGGIELIGDGYYRLDLPDAAVAAGSGENSVQIGGTVTGMIVIGNEHALVDYDPYDSLGGSPLVLGAGYVGDFLKNGTVEFTWSTIDRSGAAVTPSTAGTIKVYKSTGTTEIQVPTGITDTRSFSGTTGNHQCVIDLSTTSEYAERENYMVVLETSVIDTKAVNATIATFSIKNRYQGKEFEKDGS